MKNIYKFEILGRGISETNKILGGEFEYTEKEEILCAMGIIKDENGGVFIIYNKKHNQYQLPGGKIDLGETAEKALEREIKEEIGVEIKSMKFAYKKKTFVFGILWEGNFFDVEIIGDPKNLEPEKHGSLKFYKRFPSENHFGYVYKSDDSEELGEEIIKKIILDIFHFDQEELEKLKDSKFYLISETEELNILEKDECSTIYFEGNYYITQKEKVLEIFGGKKYLEFIPVSGKELIGVRFGEKELF